MLAAAAEGGLGALEIGFIIMVGGMSAAAGLFSLYVLAQIFRNPGRRPMRGSRPQGLRRG